MTKTDGKVRKPYRVEIDGLRAIALLSIFLFHCGMPLFSGGLIGLDIFFVISGYLITSLIVREIDEGRFSFSRFYERRARRILPMLILIMLFCVVPSWLWMLPSQFIDFAYSLIASLGISANFLFLSESGYFMPLAHEKPLLHVWSLSVEEQFYFLFPIFIWLLSSNLLHLRRIWLGRVFVLIGLVSLCIAEWGWRISPEANYYLLQGRIWEFLIGAWVALRVPLSGSTQKKSFRDELLSALGLGLLLVPVIVYDTITPMPSVFTLLPTMGTALVIAFARRGTWVQRLLASRPLAFIGSISYSAYLWHQPLLAFARLRLVAPSFMILIGLCILSLVLGSWTWKYVEQPTRDRQRVSAQMLFCMLGGGAALILILASMLISFRGFPQRFTDFQAPMLESRHELEEYRQKRFFEYTDRSAFTTARPHLLLAGDSFAQDFINMADAVGAFKDYEMISVFIPTECQIDLEMESHWELLPPANHYRCPEGAFEKLKSLAPEADVIVLASEWREWMAERLDERVANLRVKPTAQVYVLGNKSFGRAGYPETLPQTLAARTEVWRDDENAVLIINELLSRTLRHAHFIDVETVICGSKFRCPVFTTEGQLLSFDRRHLTPAGAKFAGERVFSQTELRQFRPD